MVGDNGIALRGALLPATQDVGDDGRRADHGPPLRADGSVMTAAGKNALRCGRRLALPVNGGPDADAEAVRIRPLRKAMAPSGRELLVGDNGWRARRPHYATWDVGDNGCGRTTVRPYGLTGR
ncbi:MAG: hypothetical protein ABFD96_01625 [Armatimonadia bacterium]